MTENYLFRTLSPLSRRGRCRPPWSSWGSRRSAASVSTSCRKCSRLWYQCQVTIFISSYKVRYLFRKLGHTSCVGTFQPGSPPPPPRPRQQQWGGPDTCLGGSAAGLRQWNISSSGTHTCCRTSGRLTRTLAGISACKSSGSWHRLQRGHY